jgi:membrane glycosyltransferase
MTDNPHANQSGAPIYRLPIGRRRAMFAMLVVLTITGLICLMAVTLSACGFGIIDLVILVLFAATLPWSVVGFWNATIGFLLMRFADRDVALNPAGAGLGDEPITASIAILVCIRNEASERVIRNLKPLIDGLVAATVANRFTVYVLSDTDAPELIRIEEARFATLCTGLRDEIAVHYRRREANVGYKAGNIWDFCERWGVKHELAIVLDADSFMTAEAVLRLVRHMQKDPKIGILQSLVVGLPSASAFARIFQFGMRLGMRSYTIGSAWWQADCGPYWGHNAVIRLAPFITHCRLPALPGQGPLGGKVLSHDQIEAALMRRGGYEVRVLPQEDESWEDNPPTLGEFIRRDLRWCQGNMQYVHLLGLPGLRPISRWQLVFALLMFLGSPAWIGLLLVGSLAIALADNPADVVRPDAGLALFAVVLAMWFAPKIATVLDVLMRPGARRAFGGSLQFLASVLLETLFFILLSPIMWFAHTICLLRLLFGRTSGWSAQSRDDHAVPFSVACRDFWPQTVVGIGSIGLLACTHPAAIPYALFLAGGLALSIPFAVITALPSVGRALIRLGLGQLPEETAPSEALCALALPAIATPAPATHPAPRMA